MISPNENLGAPAPLPAMPDSANHFMVGTTGGGQIVIQRSTRGYLTPAQALNLALWIVAQADPDGKEFQRLLAEIKRS